MQRRQLLQLSALGTLPASLGLFQSAFAQATGAIQFGCPVPMSGAFAANGKYADLGMKLAIEQYGTALKRPLAYTLLFITTAGADEITGADCNAATFRWSVPTFGAIEQTVRPLVDLMPKAKRWYTITPQYVFGDGLLSAAKNIFKEKGIEHVGNSYHSLAEKEFSGYITNAIAAKPDVLLLLNFGGQCADTLRQAVSFGLNKNMTILVAWASGLEQFESLGADLCEGIYFGAQYWHTVDSPLNRDLVKRTNDKLQMNPNYSLAGSYICTKLLIDGIIKAGSVDQKAVIAALEGMKYQGLTGEEEVRKADHQVLKNYYLLKAKAKAKMKNKDDYVDVLNFGKSFLPIDQTGCKKA